MPNWRLRTIAYATDTILKLREPDEDNPYNRVRVIGPSPVTHASTGEWGGQGNSQGVVLEPLTGFDTNADLPEGRVALLYEVEQEPEPIVFESQPVRVVQQADLGPSPEDVFAKAAREPDPEPAEETAADGA